MHTLSSLVALISQKPHHQQFLNEIIYNELSQEATTINNMGLAVQLEELLYRGWRSDEILREIKRIQKQTLGTK